MYSLNYLESSIKQDINSLNIKLIRISKINIRLMIN